MSGEANSARIIVTLPVTLRTQIEHLAEHNDVSVSALSRRALRKYVEQEGRPAVKQK